jgi:hypothetical protein
VYLALDERHLLERCGHYLVYGSEALAGVAAQLHRHLGWNVQVLLLQTGTPTIFAFDVPCSALSAEDLDELARNIVGELEYPPDGEPSMKDFTVAPRRRLPPSLIVRHYSVCRVHDPVLRREYVHRPV